jgi:predicted RNA-binding Zn-ribbon protein involved in translation (DUF1610 family)
MSLLEDAIGQTEALLDKLKSLAASETGAADASAREQPAESAADDIAPEGGSSTASFKCPACGQEFVEQVACINGHPAEQTLPIADVLAGAPPAAAGESAGAGGEAPAAAVPPGAPEQSGSDASSTSTSAASDGAADPSWPAGAS